MKRRLWFDCQPFTAYWRSFPVQQITGSNPASRQERPQAHPTAHSAIRNASRHLINRTAKLAILATIAVRPRYDKRERLGALALRYSDCEPPYLAGFSSRRRMLVPTYRFSSSTGLLRTPTPSISTSQTSAAFIQTGLGLRAWPTPDGVPVRMISPGSNVMPLVT